MKPFYYISLLLLTCVFAQNVLSQNQPQQTQATQQQPRMTPSKRGAANQDSGLPSLSVRATSKNEEQTKDIENVVWLRELYRQIDLKKENNAALYFPEQPIGNRMNLFTLIFKLMAQGKLTGYKYMADRPEVFTDGYKIKFEDILKSTQVLYKAQGSGNNVQFIIEDSDIPSNEVLMYMIKEAWYFDQATGTFNSKVLAICPMMIRSEDDFGEPTRTPLFWVNYEDIRPYISRAYIMTSNINNALTYTINDFFSKRMYTGDIVKTTNMMNQSLAQQAGSEPGALKHAQDSIEAQLKFFEEKLWVPKDTTAVDTKKKGKEETKTTKATTTKTTEKKEKESKPKGSKPEKSSTPTKSVRRTR